MYDCTNRKSFDNVNKWVQEIEANASDGICKLLVANKCDLTEEREVDYEMGKVTN